MQVYLTGVNTVKNPKSNSSEKIKSSFSPEKQNEKSGRSKRSKNNSKENEKNSNIIIEEDKYSELEKKQSKNISNRTFQTLKKNLNYQSGNIEKNKTNNNFISSDDTNKNKKKKFLCERDFSRIRHKNSENKKNNENMANELKEDYLEYIMLKEPKYADFEKISENHQNQIYQSFNKYNNNLLIIENKKDECKKLSSEIEKSLINNYYLKDSSMLPVYEQLIEKVKLDILTKQQEYDGYYKIYEELYNQNYTIKRKVLDEIDIDRVNENFYDQYKILKNHAIVQVSKKQDALNQVEEFQRKVLEDHEKEIKQKNKILKDLKLQIEVFKEDEKDLVNKLKKLKAKREQVIKTIKEKERKIKNINNNFIHYIRRYQKSFIGMNKIFKSVNAKNLDDVLLDVNYIKTKFNKLKSNIINKNLDISNLNSEYSNLNKKLVEIKQEIIQTQNKKKTFLNQKDQKRLIVIKNELKKLNENENRIKEITQNNIGTFQNGITFIFGKIKLLVTNIVYLKKSISPKLVELINKYKNTAFSVDYEKIDNNFLTNYALLFFQYSNIIFYLNLHSMSSGLNINNIYKKQFIVPIYNITSLNIYKDGVKKALKEYDRRSILKHEKQKEINIKTKNKEIEEKIDNKLMKENKSITQHQMFDHFIEYLHNKDKESNSFRRKHKKKDSNLDLNANKTSIFFTGVDIKSQKSGFSSSSLKYSENKYGKSDKNINSQETSLSLKRKEEFLQKNKNKVMNIFSKYQNTLVKEIDKNLYFKQKYIKKIPRSQSQNQIKKRLNFIGNENKFINKRKIIKDENFEKKNSMPNLIDENYEYDKDDYEDNNKEKLSFKKNKTFSNFSFFRLNKDRASIYKKMNDLRKLQMAYFGGRFLNTKINSGMNTTYGGNVFDEFVNNYYKRQNEQNNMNKKNNKRKLNFGKKLVDQITANQKLRCKSTAIIRKPIKKEENELFVIKERNRFRNLKDNTKTSFSIYNKKTTMGSTKKDKSYNQYKKIDASKTSSKSRHSNYRTINIKKNFINKDKNRDKSSIYNYNSKNL